MDRLITELLKITIKSMFLLIEAVVVITADLVQAVARRAKASGQTKPSRKDRQ